MNIHGDIAVDYDEVARFIFGFTPGKSIKKTLYFNNLN